MNARTKHRPPGMTCPDCGGPATQRTSKSLSSIVREVTYRCDALHCGTGFVAQIATVRITQRSAAPSPENHLPFAPLRRAANDDHPRPANDDAPPGVGAVPLTG